MCIQIVAIPFFPIEDRMHIDAALVITLVPPIIFAVAVIPIVFERAISIPPIPSDIADIALTAMITVSKPSISAGLPTVVGEFNRFAPTVITVLPLAKIVPPDIFAAVAPQGLTAGAGKSAFAVNDKEHRCHCNKDNTAKFNELVDPISFILRAEKIPPFSLPWTMEGAILFQTSI